MDRSSCAAATWLELDDGFELMAKAIGPPWEAGLESEWRKRAVGWEQARREDLNWEHRWTRCRRQGGDGEVLIHRFTQRATALDMCAELSRQAMEDLRQCQEDGTAAAMAASNVGGFHSARDLWSRSAFQATGLPSLLIHAVELAACAEGAVLGRPGIPVTAAGGGNLSGLEAWWNVLSNGAWNTLHTHPGHTYSLVYFVHTGDADGSQSLAVGAGCLAMLPGGPRQLSEEQRAHILHAPRRDSGGAAHAPGEGPLEDLEYLLIEPEPGTCVIFPSFIPHFVIPSEGLTSYRISIACNI